MTDDNEIDFGPLADLIGTWTGEEGVDIAPEPDGKETSPYYETITVSEVGGVTNAEEQNLVALHYHQIVTRKSDGQVFHNETGYWMWDRENSTVMHSLVIPRGVCVLAGGTYSGETDDDGRVVLNVSAKIDDPHWSIAQSPFMDEKARTVAFTHRVAVGGGRLIYAETTTVDIYGKVFEHTDQNALVRV